MENEELILVLSEHKHFGWKFYIYSALRTEDGNLQLLGAPDVGQEKERGVSPDRIALIKLLEEVSNQALMKAFSKQKSILAFLKEVKQETISRFIRPRIELANRKVIEAAQKTHIPIFRREEISIKTFYKENRLHIIPSPAECLFNFVKDERGLRYFISLTCEGQEISLLKKPGVILSEKPCIVLTGKQIRFVENIEAKKLTPFFEKRHIAVPAQSEELYLRNFVFKTMQTYEVKIQGIPVREIKPEKKAFLSLERDFHQKLVFVLSFQYENAPRIYPESSKKKTVELEEKEGATGIYWYKRDTIWEKHLADYLQQEGLRPKGLNHFYPEQDDAFQLVEWLNQRKDGALTEFTIENKSDRPFFIQPISVHADFEVKIDWFELHIDVVIGEYRIPFLYFRQHILERNNEYTLPDGNIFILPSEWFEKYYDLLLHCEQKDGTLGLKKNYASLLDQAIGKDISDEKLEIVSNILQIPLQRPPLPEQQAALLREYQKEGFYWLEHLYAHGFGGCLADDMGLGKTLQAITLLQHIYTEKKTQVQALPASLVVAPTSLLHNWRNELARFAPDLQTLIYIGDKRLKSGEAETIEQTFRPYQVIITSYGLMRNDIEYLREYTFQLIVLDESQYIKNPASLAYRAAEQLSAAHKLMLTGTPLENSLEDLWAQFNFVQEGLLDNFTTFKKYFIQPIVREKDKSREELLKLLIRPFLLRRTKEEVAPELPPLLQETIFCTMTEAQQMLYDTEKNRIRNLLMEMKENPEIPHNSFVTLQSLNTLRQLANHPKLVDAGYAEDSGKFEQILLSFETLKESNHKVLIFSSYVKYLNLLAAKFDEEGWKYAMLTGETLRREEEIKRFTESNDIHCFFISLKAGSTGLNLTAADYVFILDPWWNPAAEMQALSRAHRIGQQKNVIACRFISTETIEEKILRLQESKTALYETFINKNNPLSQFTWAEMEELLN
ncbi:MAG: DEAD/DEAH box helicase [Tannerellaceae bacterium]|jgi:superfamily II DNA or RNA helicase|nr:DEAD/DEAH box helicase [Tannerellaceae bacterium]